MPPDAEQPSGKTVRDDADTAIPRLVDSYGGVLYQIAQRFCGDKDQAEDLVQEVFLSAYKGWDGFRGDSSEKTWLYRIAARACERMHRKRSGEPARMASLDTALPFDEPLIAAVAGELEDGLQRQVRAEARERMEAAITELPEDFRMPLVLKEIAGFSVREVSEVLGLEEGTVRSRLHRARLKLREAVDGALPRREGVAPPPAYDQQTCLDLLKAKQEAIDRGVAFDSAVICERCRSVFAGLDLASETCRELAGGAIPEGLRGRLLDAARAGGGGTSGVCS